MANGNQKKNTPATANKAPNHDEDGEEDDETLLASALAEFDATEGEEIVAGFAPYVKPTVGALYTFVPLMVDARDPTFIRYTCQNTGKNSIMGQTGPVADAEPVEIKPGEVFSFSEFKGIPFVEMIGLNLTAICAGRRQLGPVRTPGPDFGKPRSPMFVFRFKMSRDNASQFKENRAKYALAQAHTKNLTAASAASALPVTPSTHTRADGATQQGLGAQS
jgi:hypothetical protein